MNFIKKFKRAASLPGSEHGQGLLRVSVNIPFSLYAIYLFSQGAMPTLSLFLIVANFYSSALLIHILIFPRPNPLRRCVGIVTDQLLITYF